MLGASFAALAALILGAAGLPELAVALLAVYVSYSLWRYHRRASAREAEMARLEEEERAIQEDGRRAMRIIEEASARRQEEPDEDRIDPAKAARAIGRMISGSKD